MHDLSSIWHELMILYEREINGAVDNTTVPQYYNVF